MNHLINKCINESIHASALAEHALDIHTRHACCNAHSLLQILALHLIKQLINYKIN